MKKLNIQITEQTYKELTSYFAENKHIKQYALIDKVITEGLKVVRGEK